jgi:dienelactone hydrolase
MALGTLVLGVALAAAPSEDLLGVYRFPDGRLAGVRPVADEDAWRYVDFATGASHKMHRAEGGGFQSSDDWASAAPVRLRYRFDLGPGSRARALVLEGADGRREQAVRVGVRERGATFTSANTALYGKLVLPAGGGPRHPVVVFVHGSDNAPSVDRELLPYLLAANGIGGFVFDKRGTGRSHGEYTQLFQVLADDVVAGVRWLRKQKDVNGARIGLAGFSQGGWVAPLAASREPAVRFVLVGYGLAMPVADEDRLEAPLKLGSMLHATARGGFTAEGWRRLEEKLAAYAGRPWLEKARGTETWLGQLLAMGMEQARDRVPRLFTTFFDPFYDPVPTLASLDVPMLWLLAAEDIEAPPGPTVAVLERLRGAGKPVEVVVFPGTDHGIREFVAGPGGRTTTRYAPGYFKAVVDWLKRQTR